MNLNLARWSHSTTGLVPGTNEGSSSSFPRRREPISRMLDKVSMGSRRGGAEPGNDVLKH
jgi:hypothetical protein